VNEPTRKEKQKMKLSLRIALTLTIIVVMGIITFVKIAAQATFPTTYFVIWIVLSVILIGLTVRSWLQTKKK
jgi:archaellum biogenesis protein FlaJ (TadC family)